jgi:hypothetical protein
MTRRSITAGAFVFALAVAHGTWAQAQWGYPGGFGDFGWGGWGASTAEGDVARGMGAFAAGAGFYNLNTAKAESIDTDTVIKWNNYIYESQKNANNLRLARMAQRQRNNINMRDQIRQRLRDNPERADIHRGDAINVALDEINDPRVYGRHLPASKVKVGGALIRNIPFQKASAAITVSIYQLVDGGPPAALKKLEFEAELSAIKSLGQELRRQIEADDNPDPETIKKLLAAIGKAETQTAAVLPRNSRDRNEVDRYLKALHGLIGMLQTPAINVILSGVENRPDATMAELLRFMNAFSLRFGVASTREQRQVYDSLYPKLVALRNEVAAALPKAAAPTPGVDAAENFFSRMSLEDLQKKVPPTPAPAKD